VKSTKMEVVPTTEPEQIAPSNIHLEDKFYNRSSVQERMILSNGQQEGTILSNVQPSRSDRRMRGGRTTLWTVAIVAIVCLAAALGAGLGGGLAAQRKHLPAT